MTLFSEGRAAATTIVKILKYFQSLSSREQLIIIVAGLTALLMVTAQGASLIKKAFSKQYDSLVALQLNAENLGSLIPTYLTTLKRKQEIEAQYEQIGPSDGSLSYLERTITSIMGVSPEISSLPTRPFGVRYQQIPFRVQFRTRESEKLFSLLSTLTRGTQKYLISRIEISPRTIDKQLEVIMELSSLARKEAAQ